MAKQRGMTPAGDAFEHDFAFAKKPGRTLIAGSKLYEGSADRRALYTDAVGWDIEAGDGVDAIVDLGGILPFEERNTFAHIDCLSVLEHVRDPFAVARNLQSLLVLGGTLFVAVPYIWRPHSYPVDYWRFSVDALRVLFTHIEWDAMRYVGASVEDEQRKIACVKIDEHPFYPRTETCGFGRRIL